MTDETSAEKEFEATRTVYSSLASLDPAARARVLSHVAAMLGIDAPKVKKPVADETEENEASNNSTPPIYKTFAELFDAAQPQTTAHRALVAGYWIQECEGAENFDGQRANRELNHLGHKVPNITNALASLNGQKPALAIQLKKSGTSQQARKTYKITGAGVAAVKTMLHG